MEAFDRSNLDDSGWISTSNNIGDAFKKRTSSDILEASMDTGLLTRTVRQWEIRSTKRPATINRDYTTNGENCAEAARHLRTEECNKDATWKILEDVLI